MVSHLHYKYPNTSGRTLNTWHPYLTMPLNSKVHHLTVVLSMILDKPSLVLHQHSEVRATNRSFEIHLGEKRGYAAATGRPQVRALNLLRSRRCLSRYMNVTMMSSGMWMPSGGTKSDADGLRFQALKPCGRVRRWLCKLCCCQRAEVRAT
ncbi:hypothetical protein EDC04DRAFT_160837 [Pisolithus marmoratus]|nr:hypothetical protein EDC04DRAFT_160837 [Pisolithus marmoratus]